jgi:chemotaxis protein MotA
MAANPTPKQARRRPDFASFLGLALALGGISYGFHLEHGSLVMVTGVSAAFIVLGGSLGATLVANPLPVCLAAARRLQDLFFEQSSDPGALTDRIIEFATKARKNGIVSLEQEAAEIPDPFLRKSLTLAIDGADLQEIRSMMDLEISVSEQQADKEAKVYEAAGGFAPTIGIIGAVLGLMLVMQNLENMKEVGKGIATAFIATIYGVGSANLFFLPAAHKIKARAHLETQRRELMLEGVLSIVEGLNPKLIRTKLEAYSQPSGSPARRARGAPAAQSAAESGA